MYIRRRSFLLAFVSSLLTGCAGPGPVLVVTEEVRITTVPEETLFGSSVGLSPATKMVEIVEFNLSSETDFHRHFKDRLMQVRCDVEGNTDQHWFSFGFGPFYRGIELSSSRFRESGLALTPRVCDGRYAYTVYAFADLSVSWLEGGHLSRRTSLESLEFSRLSCFIIGVAKAPVSFPRSNEFVLDREEFIALQSSRRAAAPLMDDVSCAEKDHEQE